MSTTVPNDRKQKPLLSKLGVYCIVVTILLILATSAFFVLEPSRQEHMVWIATGMWFSAEGMDGAVNSTTSLPSEETPVQPLAIMQCFVKIKPQPETLAAFQNENLRQRRILFGRGKLQRDTRNEDDSPMLDRLASKLIGEQVSNTKQLPELIFSRVGFNRQKTEALVYAEYLCPLCGYGGYFSLQKQGEGWVIADVCARWVS